MPRPKVLLSGTSTSSLIFHLIFSSVVIWFRTTTNARSCLQRLILCSQMARLVFSMARKVITSGDGESHSIMPHGKMTRGYMKLYHSVKSKVIGITTFRSAHVQQLAIVYLIQARARLRASELQPFLYLIRILLLYRQLLRRMVICGLPMRE